MSKNVKYIEDFDRNAGKPSDFDTLFRFDGNNLVAKRRIRVKSNGKRIAAMCSAAAVIGVIAWGSLTYISTNGIASDAPMGISEAAAGLEPITDVKRSIEPAVKADYEADDYSGMFDYSCENDFIGNYIRVSHQNNNTEAGNNADIIMRFVVTSKSYINNWDSQNADILYTVHTIESYTKNDYLGYDNESFVITAYENSDEFQIGQEYIAPLNIISDGSDEIMRVDYYDNKDLAQLTPDGWIIESEGSGDNTDGYNIAGCILSDSSESIFDTYISENGSDYQYYSYENEEPVISCFFSDVLGSTYFESVGYSENKDGSVDKTILILDNDNFLSLILGIDTTTVFSGINNAGENQVVLTINDHPDNSAYPAVIVFSGFEEVTSFTSDVPNNRNSVIGKCSSKPLYMQVLDNYGRPVEIDIDE